jgi:hypothetical protein
VWVVAVDKVTGISSTPGVAGSSSVLTYTDLAAAVPALAGSKAVKLTVTVDNTVDNTESITAPVTVASPENLPKAVFFHFSLLTSNYQGTVRK